MGQVVAIIVPATPGEPACASFLIDDAGVREIVGPGERGCTRVHDINDHGVVVGSVGEPPRPFLWQDGVAWPTDASGTPVAVNNANQVALDSGLLWDAGEITELVVPGGERLVPTAMNNATQIVGHTASSSEGYLWQAGDVVELPLLSPKAINDHGHVVGIQDDYVGTWDGSAFIRYGSVDDISPYYPMAVNNLGELVGTIDDSPGDWPRSPFVGTPASLLRLANAGEAYDINDRGDVIGQVFSVRWHDRLNFSVTPSHGEIWSRSCWLVCCVND